ncbi:hypothetical protein [Kineococcus sp. SYSU DK002]|uniref:hypothetical protein n=1 Tax=Kineococcus sp. SYSU DK002 TaxID=3383123 RepID=UPI003D7C4CD8
MSPEERRRRWAGTARTAAAGTVLGAAGGAVTGTWTLLGDEGFSTGAAVFFGTGLGALVGAVLGVFSGAVAGCLAVHLAPRHALLARVAPALCCGVLIGLAAAGGLPPGAHRPGWAAVAGGVAAAAAWSCTPWCLRSRPLPVPPPTSGPGARAGGGDGS